jgi:HSP20 family molecular chaperone IbpA
MDKLSVRHLVPDDPEAQSLLESFNQIQDAIRQRAFGLFEARGTTRGSEMEDWVHAESELVWVPSVETMEDDKEFRLHLIVPGVEAKDLQITAMPKVIVVQAESLSRESSAVPFGELRDRKLLRRFDFDEPIDPDRTEASLSKGILEIVARKAAPVREQVKVAVHAA